MERIRNYRELLDALFDGVYFLDPNRKIVYWNSAAERITGFSAAEVVGKSCADGILRHVDESGTDLCTGLCPAGKTLRDGLMREADVFLHHKEGHRVPVSVRVTPVRNRKGEITGVIELFSDGSFKNAMIEKIRELEGLALLDPLTLSGNRRFLEMSLQGRLQEKARTGISFGLLFADVDHFKRVNDTYGHQVGDRVLRMVCNALRSSLRPFDDLGRWGGEEFVALLRNVDQRGLERVAERLRIMVKKSFLSLDGLEIAVTVSMGGTLARDEDTPTRLLQRADEHMYRSKIAGRDCIHTDEGRIPPLSDPKGPA